MRLSSGLESIANHLSRQSTVRSRETERYSELSPYGRVRIVCDSMCGIMHKIKRTLQERLVAVKKEHGEERAAKAVAHSELRSSVDAKVRAAVKEEQNLPRGG